LDQLYGLREDTESMHHHLKERLGNGRARCVGPQRQRINLHAYQLRTSMTAVLAWHLRTDADLTPWFGRWQPPGRAGPVAA
jgi:starvation-inducible outer membrane lipoprotein